MVPCHPVTLSDGRWTLLKGSGWLAMAALLMLLEFQPWGCLLHLMTLFFFSLRVDGDCGCRWRRDVAERILIGQGSVLH